MIKAQELHRRYPGLSLPIDMEAVAAREGCICVTWDFLEPVREVKRGRWIGLAKWLDERERRRCIAHALGHHLLHSGNQLCFQGWQRLSRRKQEREAEEFAAHFLVPGGELGKIIALRFSEMAELLGVPEDLLCRRLTEFATEAERETWRARSCEL